MSVVRINQFKALAGKGPEVVAAFQEVLPKICTAEGCESCELLINAENQDQVVIIEQWRDISAHQAAAKLIDPKDFQRIMGLLEGKPSGTYYTANENQS